MPQKGLRLGQNPFRFAPLKRLAAGKAPFAKPQQPTNQPSIETMGIEPASNQLSEEPVSYLNQNDKSLLKTSSNTRLIESLNIPTAIKTILMKNNIFTVDDIIKLDPIELKSIKGLGKKRLEILMSMIP
jgi:DNA-directed RNA polymerase alpha subunit